MQNLRLQPLFEQLSIKTKRLGIQKFNLNYIDPIEGDLGWAQRIFVAEIERQFNAHKPVRIIVLKARQVGISTATEALLFWWSFLFKGSNGLVMAHEGSSSEELFQMTKLYWETFPFQSLYTLKYNTKQNMHWLETRSRLRITTAKSVAGGRGSTVHALHASECAFYNDPDTLWTALDNAIPDTFGSVVIKESTANGVGNYFYNDWQLAKEGASDYVPLFFPWYMHPEYKLPTTLNVKAELNAEEKQLLRIGASYENIAWRRRKIEAWAHGDVSKFHQEYPSTDEEAFIVSGQPIFSALHLKDCYHAPGCECGCQTVANVGRLIDLPNGRVKWVSDPSGCVTIFKAPRKGNSRSDQYFVGGDPSETVRGDPASIQVINRQTFEQVAVYHGHSDPTIFAYEMMKLGKFYNNAMVCPEVQGGGQAAIHLMIHCGYPNIWNHKTADSVHNRAQTFGWLSNRPRKDFAIGQLQHLIVTGTIILHDRRTYEELRNYILRSDGTMGNADDKVHDDSVMGLAIACAGSIMEGPFVEDTYYDNPITAIWDQEYDELAYEAV